MKKWANILHKIGFFLWVILIPVSINALLAYPIFFRLQSLVPSIAMLGLGYYYIWKKQTNLRVWILGLSATMAVVKGFNGFWIDAAIWVTTLLLFWWESETLKNNK